MPKMFQQPLAIGLVGFLIGMTGLSCQPTEQRLPVHPVRGQLYVAGKPARGALVALHPIDKSDPRWIAPRGRVQDDGSFELSTYEAKDGAAVGRYKVTIDYRKSAGITPDDEGVSQVPAAYVRPETSPLEVEISENLSELPPIKIQF
jgi:5-hydroxyisourate hydrolase-like protein (transthyretin family)